jgi:hypothetical protein
LQPSLNDEAENPFNFCFFFAIFCRELWSTLKFEKYFITVELKKKKKHALTPTLGRPFQMAHHIEMQWKEQRFESSLSYDSNNPLVVPN